MGDPALDDDLLTVEDAQAPLLRRLATEFVGTVLFVAIGTGAATVLGIGAATRLGAMPQLPPGAADPQQTAFFQALLSNGFADTLAVALAFAFGLAVMVYAFGGISGAHFNPAVTFGLAVGRRFPWGEVPFYWVAQCLGAVGGAFVIAGIYRQTGASIGETDIMFGATAIAQGVGTWQAILAETFITFVLVTAVMAVAVDPRAPKGFSGLGIGLALGAGILVTATATGGSANFARSLGPFVASLPFDLNGDIPWGDLLVYAVGPLIGASAAVLIYESLTGLEVVAPAPQPGAATPGTTPPEEELYATEPVEDDTPPGV